MIGGVPVTIGFAWLMVIAGSHEIAKTITNNRSFFLLIGSALAVMIDLILDPVAFIVKEYWIWTEGGFFYDIPLSNFLGWFFLSLLFHGIGSLLINQEQNLWGPRIAFVFGGVQFMFIWLAVLGGIYWAAFINGVLLVFWIAFYSYKYKDNFKLRRFL